MPIKILPLSMKLIRAINIFESNIEMVRERERESENSPIIHARS